MAGAKAMDHESVATADRATDRWRQGDRRAALEIAFATAGPTMRATARRIAGDASADIVQDALLRVWDHPLRFDAERGTLASYLVVTTRGTALDHVRGSQRRRVREERTVRDLDAVPDREGTDLDQLRRLQGAVAALAHDERVLIASAFVEGLSYRSIAVLLGVPEGTVKSRMRRTLGRLRADLGPVED